MPRPCTVCAHLKRAEIDQRLAFQVVNMSQLSREYGVGKDAIRGHRAKHLPAFLPAFQARADALTLDTLSAEAQRLYLVSLDALAAAERGVLIEVGEDGTEYRKVSSTSIARLLREARTTLGMLASLAADGAGPEETAKVANTELDSRIAAALDRVASREIVDAELVEDEEPAIIGVSSRPEDPRALPVGGGSWSGQRGVSGHDEGVPLDAETPSERISALDELRARAQAAGLSVNAATSLDELKAMGVDTTRIDPDRNSDPASNDIAG